MRLVWFALRKFEARQKRLLTFYELAMQFIAYEGFKPGFTVDK